MKRSFIAILIQEYDNDNEPEDTEWEEEIKKLTLQSVAKDVATGPCCSIDQVRVVEIKEASAADLQRILTSLEQEALKR